MPSLSDELSSKIVRNGSKAAQVSLKAAGKTGKNAVKAGGSAVKGLCLVILDGGAFTAESVMKAAKNAAFKKTGDIRYSKNNIDIAKLQKSGHVYKIDDNITADVMKYFDAQCKKYKIKYSAMRDERNPDKPAYMVFFEGKSADLILQAMQESYKDYLDAQKKDMNKGRGNGKERPRERESIKAKLAFFRNRAAAGDRERDGVEKKRHRSDIQR